MANGCTDATIAMANIKYRKRKLLLLLRETRYGYGSGRMSRSRSSEASLPISPNCTLYVVSPTNIRAETFTFAG